MPTLIVWGDHDRIIPLDHAYRAHEAIPNSRLEVIEGVGHYPLVEEPVRFVEILRDFLRTTEPSKFNPEEQLDCCARVRRTRRRLQTPRLPTPNDRTEAACGSS
jgi:hypothetical protein